jgi:plastocyanin
MRSTTIALLAVLALVLVACGDDDTTSDTTEAPTTTAAPATTEAPIAADAVALTISGFDFGDPITVPIGTEVTITNEDGAPHTWTSNDGVWDSGSLSGGDSFSFTFNDAGEYAFFCGIHPSMTGSITVTG